MCYNIEAYYQLSNEKRDIIDNVAVTEGDKLKLENDGVCHTPSDGP